VKAPLHTTTEQNSHVEAPRRLEPGEPRPALGRGSLWLPFEVDDLDAARRFYADRLGLEPVDGWQRDGERGVVLRAAGSAFIELVSPVSGDPRAFVVAFEHRSRAQVDAAFGRLAPRPEEIAAPPHTYPRGHYGFALRGPAGVDVMLWSEACR